MENHNMKKNIFGIWTIFLTLLIVSMSWAENTATTDAKYKEAESYFDQQNYAKTIEILNEAIVTKSDDFEYLDLLARAYYVLGEKEKSKVHFQRVIDLLSKIVEQEPDKAEYHMLLANAYHLLGENEKAKEHYERIMMLNTDDETTEMAYVSRALASSDFTEQKFWLKKAIEKVPFPIAAYSVLISLQMANAISIEASGDVAGALKLLVESREAMNNSLTILDKPPDKFTQDQGWQMKESIKERLKGLDEREKEWKKKLGQPSDVSVK